MKTRVSFKIPQTILINFLPGKSHQLKINLIFIYIILLIKQMYLLAFATNPGYYESVKFSALYKKPAAP